MGELLGGYRKYVVFLARSGLHHHMHAKPDPSDLAQEVCLAITSAGTTRAEAEPEAGRLCSNGAPQSRAVVWWVGIDASERPRGLAGRHRWAAIEAGVGTICA